MSEENLTPRQQAMYEGYEIIAEAFGMWDKGVSSNGAHYIEPEDNVFAEKGLVCANCVYYEGGRRCEIVAGDIDPFAACKLWIIEDRLVDPNRLEKRTYSPPDAVRQEARRALKWIDEGHAGGGFTPVGRKRASDLARGAGISIDTIRRMRSYLARHEVDKQGEGWSPSQNGYPSPGRVAWAAWGGDPAKSWVNGIVNDLEDVAKAKFGNRSQAGRYAAQVRWGKSGGSGGDAPKDAANKISLNQPAEIRPEDIPATMAALAGGQGDPNLYNLTILGGAAQLSGGQNPAALADRAALPQVPSANKAQFVDEMRNRGLKVDMESVNPEDLKPIQNHLSATKVSQMYGRFSAGKNLPTEERDRMVVSKDGFIIDGHHRYAAGVLMSYGPNPMKLNVYRVDANKDELLGIVSAWNRSAGIRSIGVGESNPQSMFKAAFYRAVDEVVLAKKDNNNG